MLRPKEHTRVPSERHSTSIVEERRKMQMKKTEVNE